MGAVSLLKSLISCPSVTPEDGGALDLVRSFLPEFEAIELHKGKVKNLLLRKRYGEGVHLCFAGHVDVVPAGEGWESNPFEAVEKEGYVYGRGAQDMKSGIAAFVVAIKNLSDFRGTLSIILTSDEEGDGVDGTDVVLQWMKENNTLPDMCIVAEPTCEEQFGDAYKVGRRGSLNGKLVIKGLGGHAAYPQKARNPIEMISSVLPHFSGVNLDNGDEFFAPSRFVMTTLHSGHGTTNVIPHELTLLFNVRNNTLTSKDDVKTFVTTHLLSHHIHEYDLEIRQSSSPFITKEGAFSQHLTQTLEEAIYKVTGITPKRSTSGGTSDARYVASYGVDVVEFGVRNDTIHAPNERTPIEDVENLSTIFYEFMTRL